MRTRRCDFCARATASLYACTACGDGGFCRTCIKGHTCAGLRRVPWFAALTLLLSACSVDFSAPPSWQEAARDIAIEQALPTGLPEPGPRPASFRCTVVTSVGLMTVSGDSPAWTTFELEGRQPTTVPTPANGFISVDLRDGTDVFVYGDLLVFDGASTRLGDPECQ